MKKGEIEKVMKKGQRKLSYAKGGINKQRREKEIEGQGYDRSPIRRGGIEGMLGKDGKR